MNNAIGIAEEIRDKISELPEAKEYIRLKEIIDKDEEITRLQKEIISKQNSGETEEAEKLLSRLNSLPIVVNFQQVKEQLAQTLKQVANILK